MSTRARLAIVTDIHHGHDSHTKKGEAALPLLEAFTATAAAERPDAVIELGDRISDRDAAADRARLSEVAAVFDGRDLPRLHLPGNHDVAHLSPADNADIFGHGPGHEAVDVNGWRLLLWRADVKITRPRGFTLQPGDLEWLAAALAGTDRPTAVFSHVPLSGQSQAGNYYFERNAQYAAYPETAQIRAVLATCAQPLVCIAGHVHWNTVTVVDGIPHLTLQSLSESFTTSPEPAGAYAFLTLDSDIAFQVFGRDPFQARLDAASAGRRWLPPLPPFDKRT